MRRFVVSKKLQILRKLVGTITINTTNNLKLLRRSCSEMDSALVSLAKKEKRDLLPDEKKLITSLSQLAEKDNNLFLSNATKLLQEQCDHPIIAELKFNTDHGFRTFTVYQCMICANHSNSSETPFHFYLDDGENNKHKIFVRKLCDYPLEKSLKEILTMVREKGFYRSKS